MFQKKKKKKKKKGVSKSRHLQHRCLTGLLYTKVEDTRGYYLRLSLAVLTPWLWRLEKVRQRGLRSFTIKCLGYVKRYKMARVWGLLRHHDLGWPWEADLAFYRGQLKDGPRATSAQYVPITTLQHSLNILSVHLVKMLHAYAVYCSWKMLRVILQWNVVNVPNSWRETVQLNRTVSGLYPLHVWISVENLL